MNDTTTHQYSTVIREHHLDTFGHVNNAIYLQLFEEARWQVITERGYGLNKIRETQQGPTILEIELKFAHEIRLREAIIIHTELLSYEKKICLLKQWITDSRQQVCCTAVFKVGLFDVRERKLILPTPAWLKALGIEEPGP